MQQITLSVNEFNCKSSAILESDLGDTDDIIYKLFRREGGGYLFILILFALLKTPVKSRRK